MVLEIGQILMALRVLDISVLKFRKLYQHIKESDTIGKFKMAIKK